MANLVNRKSCKKNGKMVEFLANGYSSDSTQQDFPMNTNMTGFRWYSKYCCVRVRWTKVASALEGLRMIFASKYRLITIIGLIPQFGHYKSCAQHQAGIFVVFLLTFIQKTECLFQYFFFIIIFFLGGGNRLPIR